MAGRPAGAQNKDKPFRDALRMELAEAGEDHKKLRSIARAMIAKAEDGDTQAAFQIRDTLDGKPAQALIGGDDEDAPIRVERIERVIVNATDKNSTGL